METRRLKKKFGGEFRVKKSQLVWETDVFIPADLVRLHRMLTGEGLISPFQAFNVKIRKKGTKIWIRIRNSIGSRAKSG